MNTTRRTFIGTTAASALAMATDLGVANTEMAEKPIKMGLIGAGWWGGVVAKAAIETGSAEILAICDIDSEQLEKAAAKIEQQQGKRPQTFKLYEKLLDEMKLDAVIIGTPPHWHALQLQAALKKGLHVYCEKPLSYDMREGQAMVKMVKDSGKVVQVGFQRRGSESYKQVKEYIASGELGKIKAAEVQIHYNAVLKDPTPKDPPATLDWELWCGPAPKIPYSDQVGRKSWRLEKTTGNGHLVDWGIHNIDAARYMLGLSMPKRVTADGGIYHFKDVITTPDTLTAHFEFDTLPVVWRHRLWGSTEVAPEYNNGCFLYGEKGTVFASDNRWEIIREADKKKVEKEVFHTKTNFNLKHMKDFLHAIRTGSKPFVDIESGYKSTATVQLAMIAYETKSAVLWDEASGNIINNPAAEKRLKRQYRKPWVHPG